MKVKVLAILGVLLLLSVPIALAQDCCLGDFDCDNDVDGTDLYNFTANYGREDCDYSGICDCPASIMYCDKALVPKTGQPDSWATGDDGFVRSRISTFLSGYDVLDKI